MSPEWLLYLGSGLTFMWGLAHLFPTKGVVKGFGDISADNRRIITMEWITEGVALMFIGVLNAVVARQGAREIFGSFQRVAPEIHLLSAICLLALAVVSLFTGFRVNFLPYKLCPFIFTASATLFIVGGVL